MLLRERNPSSEPEWADVVRNIRLALALDDRYLPARNQLALAYLQQAGDDPNSQRIFLAGLVCQQAIQVAQAQQANISADVRGYVADLYNTWGVIDFRRREIIKALEHFQRAYTLRPSMYEAWVNYGTINLSFRGFRDARDAFQHAVELRGDSFDAHLGLGVALRGLSQEPSSANERETLLRQAQQEYERAQQLDQNRPESYYNQGLLHMSYTGNTIPELRQALTFLNNFVSRAGSQPRYADAVQRANRHIRNINETIAVLETNAPQGGSGTPPATPPTAPAPPAGGATPPAAGATPPAAARP
jgi:tetratricopeptide (TPR) repeat protein